VKGRRKAFFLEWEPAGAGPPESLGWRGGLSPHRAPLFSIQKFCEYRLKRFQEVLAANMTSDREQSFLPTNECRVEAPRVTVVKGRATSDVTQIVTQTVTPGDSTNAERQRRWRKNHPSKHRVQQRKAYAARREAERAENLDEVDPATVIIEREKLAREAQAQAAAAWMSVGDWLAQKPAAERQEWAGVEETLIVWEQVGREVRESKAIAQALYFPELDGPDKAAADEAGKRMKELHISREEMLKEGFRNWGYSFDRVLEARRAAL
jgi:hypothetical protein